MGRDLDGETFHEKTDIMLEIGDTRPVTYYHGFGPDDPWDWQEEPIVIGLAKLAKKDKKGFWFDVVLDESEPLAKRILLDIEKSRASSGAVGHLVRMGKAGMIDVWPVGELALFDTNEWRLPANDFAVVQEKKSEEPEAEAKADEAKADAAQPEIENIKANKGKTKMDSEINTEEKQPEKAPALEIDYTKMGEALTPIIEKTVDGAVEKKLKALADEEPTIKGVPVVMKTAKPGFSDDAAKGFIHWMKTGERNGALIPAVKTDLQEGSDTEGGVLVPEEFIPKIFGKADERSVAIRAGATVIPTSLSVVDIPIEGTQASWSLTSEEGTYGTSAEEFDQVQVNVYKSTVSPKISEELLNDNKANLETWLFDKLGARFAVHENSYTIVGTGSSQPQGVLYGGTAGLTLDDTNSIAVGEIPELAGKLKEQYHPGAVWTMKRATYFYLLGLTGNQFQLWQPKVGLPSGMGDADGVLLDHPVLFTDSMEAYSTTGKKSLCLGDWSMYALVRNTNITALRNPYLYAATGQVAFHFKARWGGAVIQAEAFQYATQA
jgi:HK97 family phage major capsid protein